MQTCKKCVLNERFIGIRFDEDGICNFCRSAKSLDQQRSIRGKYEAKFQKLIEENKGKGSYDCLVAYSGGKDSTYTLHLLQERYDLRLLAYSFDNWFQSDRARRNIRAVLSNINVDHLTVTPSFEGMKKIVLASMSDDMYSAKAMVRASSICTSCISLVRFIGFRLTIEQEIPFLIFGMSPGQAPMATAVKNDAGDASASAVRPIGRYYQAVLPGAAALRQGRTFSVQRQSAGVCRLR